ncbi:Hsp 24 nucleotide exchange factor [Buchnera aphidicola (Cinara tujafilina)]|uniref:Protein GrpE n=1 Tax=Buchnera aphidicola (Cinara tujafilina) TaxID=261317 RepID=F7WZ94_9GAMM|nr:nucleotide exchange factor GrpE [Buchnera aphidicola]AEH39748.1 Hsp 24 nucleotide exchange factor [Buchnera aphidicola (Cinara tujafilina)]
MLNDNNENNISSNSSTIQEINSENNKIENELVRQDSIEIKIKNLYISLLKKYETLVTEQLKNNEQYKEEILHVSKNLEKKIKNIYNFFLDKHFIAILPILDNIESSLDVLKNTKDNKIFIEILIKLKELHQLFLTLFIDFGITIINKINIPFNPSIHQAMSIDFSGKYLNNYVSNIIQKGYLLNNRLLRPALVSVAQSKI